MNVALPRIWDAMQGSSFRAQRAVVLVAPLSGALCNDCFPWAARLLALAHGFYEDCKRDVELSLTFLHFDILH